MPVAGENPPAISDHPAHPGHKLNRVANDGGFFICAGCKEPGAGTRYRCDHESCNFELHTCCAAAPDTMADPLLGDRVFVFLLEAPAPTTSGGKDSGKRRVCVACGEEIRGFVYHSFDDDGLDLHPCCASLPEHAAVRDEHVVSPQRQAPRPRDMTGDSDRGREIIRPAAAHHRRWAGWLVSRRDQPQERTLQHGHVTELRHEASRPSDASDDRNRRREHRPPPARHRRW